MCTAPPLQSLVSTIDGIGDKCVDVTAYDGGQRAPLPVPPVLVILKCRPPPLTASEAHLTAQPLQLGLKGLLCVWQVPIWVE